LAAAVVAAVVCFHDESTERSLRVRELVERGDVAIVADGKSMSREPVLLT
jgi:hypothetical protein